MIPSSMPKLFLTESRRFSDLSVFNPDTEKESEKAISAALDYTSYDWMEGFNYSARLLEKDMFTTDFRKVRKLEVPVYLFLGRHDWNVPSVLVETFFQNITAPSKQIIWFEYSGHNPQDEEAKKFNDIMINTIAKIKLSSH